MRSLVFGSLLVGLSILVACGDDTSGGGGTGGSSDDGGGGSGDGGSPATGGMGGTPTTGGGGEGGGTGGGSGDCIEITDATDFNAGSNFFYGIIVPALGGAAEDDLEFVIPDGVTGSNTLALAATLEECDTGACSLVEEDFDAETGETGKFYFATSGTLDLGTTTPPFYITGTLTDATYVEVTVDFEAGTVAPVAGGGCLHVESFAFDVQPPVAGWTCDPSYYGDMLGCDCECGAQDSDCGQPDQDVLGCDDETAVCEAGVCNPPNP